MSAVLSPEQLHNRIRETYNSGDSARAVALAVEFRNQFPDHYLARYSYAVMHGDFSHSPLHSEAERRRLTQIAREGIRALYQDPEFSSWPEAFQYRVRNEYFWFFELHLEQYRLGITELECGRSGHYSACVGASMMAYKFVGTSVKDSEKWALIAIEHFLAFEKCSPNWYNINFFAAQAMACLGRLDEARATFLDIYRKQGAPVNPLEVDDFESRIREIQRKRLGKIVL